MKNPPGPPFFDACAAGTAACRKRPAGFVVYYVEFFLKSHEISLANWEKFLYNSTKLWYRGRCRLGEVFAVLSGKGGTGKTSVCAGIASALAESGLRVLAIDCDVGLRNLDISLGMTDTPALSFLDVMRGDYSLEEAARHPMYERLYFLTAPMNCPAEQIDRAGFAAMLEEARRKFDAILLDAPAGLDSGFLLTAVSADRHLLVTGAGPAAVRDAARVGDVLELMGKRNVRMIVNRVSREMLGTVRVTIDDVMDTAGVPLLGVVLEDPSVTLAASFGRPLLYYARRGPAAQGCRRIARRLQGLYEPITLK